MCDKQTKVILKLLEQNPLKKFRFCLKTDIVQKVFQCKKKVPDQRSTEKNNLRKSFKKMIA